jgi:hypothetical protein
VYPPGTGVRAQVVALVMACGVVAATLFALVPAVRDLAADFCMKTA